MLPLDRKLAAIAGGSYTGSDFILADAKDADMANPITGAGPHRGPDGRDSGTLRSRGGYCEAMLASACSGQVDVLLMSAANAERMTQDSAFIDSGVTPAVRLNDTTDIWLPRGGRYATQPSRPFRSANLARVRPFCDLGLYSMTFANDLDADYRSLEAYRIFRDEACSIGMRHFLEVFTPNVECGLAAADVGSFVNDMIARTLAGCVRAERPLFLKIPYFSAAAMRELARFDEGLPVGILGGGKGTTRDTFELLAQAEEAGARVALFGRKINLAEHPGHLLELMRAVVEGRIDPENAVVEYHYRLTAAGLVPDRPLAADRVVTDATLQAEG